MGDGTCGSPFLDLDTSLKPPAVFPRYLLYRSCVGLISGLNDVDKWKFSTLQGLELVFQFLEPCLCRRYVARDSIIVTEAGQLS
jgi:hypothetical protein